MHIIEQSKLHLLMLSGVHILTLVLKIMIKVLNLKLATIWERKSKNKIFLQKITNQIGLEKFSLLKNLKNTVPWKYVIEDLNVEKIKEKFMKKS